jgi:hypothetical protein
MPSLSLGWIIRTSTQGWARAVGFPDQMSWQMAVLDTVNLSLICRRHVADMSPTRVNVAKSWPTLRVVATQKRPRHTQFISITTDKYKSAQTYGYLSYIEFLCLSSNNNHEITDMSGIPRHVVKCRVILDTLPTRHFLVSAT